MFNKNNIINTNLFYGDTISIDFDLKADNMSGKFKMYIKNVNFNTIPIKFDLIVDGNVNLSLYNFVVKDVIVNNLGMTAIALNQNQQNDLNVMLMNIDSNTKRNMIDIISNYIRRNTINQDLTGQIQNFNSPIVSSPIVSSPIVSSPIVSNTQNSQNDLNAFLIPQLNGLLKLPEIINQISPINLNLRSNNSGCVGAKIPFVGCAGCSWAYDVQLNNVVGIDKISLKSFSFSDIPKRIGSSNNYEVGIIIQANIPSGVYITSRVYVQACTPAARITLNPDIKPTINSDVVVDGKLIIEYNQNTDETIYRLKNIKINNLFVKVNFDVSKLFEGSNFLSILRSVVSAPLNAITGAVARFVPQVPSLISSKVSNALNNVLKSNNQFLALPGKFV